jgi:hypothetical protein
MQASAAVMWRAVTKLVMTAAKETAVTHTRAVISVFVRRDFIRNYSRSTGARGGTFATTGPLVFTGYVLAMKKAYSAARSR